MEGFSTDTAFASAVSKSLSRTDRFTLLDIGCSGGLDAAWRAFGANLTAFCFDPSLDECERLQTAETNANVHYIAGFVGVDPADPIALRKVQVNDVHRNPGNRLAVNRSIELRTKARQLAENEKMALNLWSQTRLADPSKPIVLPDFFAARGIDDIDFIKIDIDGPDFDVLQTIEADLKSKNVLGLGMEVNWIGGTQTTDHTFHNTDRFMRNAGFDLFNVTVRRYSVAALPGRYARPHPSMSLIGRPFQGDAVYALDLCTDQDSAASAAFARLKPAKILKTAAIMSLTNLPDHAAEILIKYRGVLDAICDVDELLNLLAQQILPGSGMTYAQYIQAFEADDPIFYPV